MSARPDPSPNPDHGEPPRRDPDPAAQTPPDAGAGIGPRSNDPRAEVEDRLLDALLLASRPDEDDAHEQRIARALAQLEQRDAVDPAATKPAPGAMPVPPRAGLRFAGAPLRRLGPWLAAAAVIALLLLWQFGFTGPSSFTLLQRAIAASAEPVDRLYELKLDLSREGTRFDEPMRLALRGAQHAVLIVERPLGQFRMGTDGTDAWLVGPRGRLVLEDDRPPLIFRWLSRRIGLDLASLHLHQLLNDMARDYDLAEPEPVDQPDGTQLLHIRGQAREARSYGPTRIDFWTHPDTGVVHRLELAWPDDTRRGPRSLTLRLLDQRPLPDHWFTPPPADG